MIQWQGSGNNYVVPHKSYPEIAPDGALSHMSSLWNQLCKIVSGDRAKKLQDVEKNRAKRRLRMEMLDKRQLLAADLVGTVFHDVGDNGIEASDPRLAGVQIALFRDGGNGTYNSGAGTAAGGDDILVGTTTSAASTGLYKFEGIDTAGTYYIVQVSPSGSLIQREATRVQSVVLTAADLAEQQIELIDSFDTTTQNVASPATTDHASSSSVAAPEAFGGERDLFANAATGVIEIRVNNTGLEGQLSLDASSGSSGERRVVYDGVDGNGDTINTTGLGGIDLTDGGRAKGVRMLAGTDSSSAQLTIRIHSGGNSSTLTVSVPVTNVGTPDQGAPTAVIDFNFADFIAATGSGADFTNVGAIEIFVPSAAGAADISVDSIFTYGNNAVTRDFANLTPMSIGDLVFSDYNNNGLFEPTGTVPETGIAGIDLHLFEDTNENGVYDPGVDQAVESGGVTRITTTDANGNYLFDDLLPGQYFVVIPSSEFATGSPAYGHIVSSTVPAGVDNNANTAVTIVSGGVVTGLISLVAGAAPTNDGDTDNNTDLGNDIGLVPQYDLTIEKTTPSTSVRAGEMITYTLTARNEGPGAAHGVVITDDIPDGISIISVTSNVETDVIQIPASAQDTNGANPDDIRIEVGSLDASSTAQRTITVVARVHADAVGEGTTPSLTNTVTIEGVGTELDQLPNTDSVTTPLIREAVLELTKTATPDSAQVGGQITYTLNLKNNGPSTARDVVISDLLPAGLDLVSVESNMGTATGTQGVDGGRDSISVTIPSLDVDTESNNVEVVVTIIATVLSTFTGNLIENTATADSSDSEEVEDDAETPLTREIDLAITKAIATNPASTSTPAVAPVNSTFTYTIVARNDGPSTATTVRVTDNLPDGIKILSVTSSDTTDTITLPASAQDDNASNPDDIIVEVGTLATGSTNQTTITIVGVVLPSMTGVFTNNVTIAATDTTANQETNLTNNSASVAATAPRTIDLEIDKSGPATAVAGNTITYTLTAKNNGPSDATDVVVTDNIPDGLRIISATINGTAITIPTSASDTNPLNPDNLVFNVGALASGASNNTIQIVAAILPNTTAALVNQAVISTTDTTAIETVTTNNTDTVTTTLTLQNDVAVVKTGPATAVAGTTITYTMNVTNNGPSTATAINLVDTLPAGVTYVSGTSTIGGTAAGTVSGGSGNTASVTIPSLNPGQSAVVTIIASVASNTSGTVTNGVTITAANDTNQSNNSSSAVTTITVPVISTISGRVYFDANRDGIGQATEAGIANALITLTGTPTGTTTPITRTVRSNANGEYTFENVQAGTYTVSSDIEGDYRFQAANPGSTGGTSGIEVINGIPLVTVPSEDNDFGYTRPLSKRMFLASAFVSQ